MFSKIFLTTSLLALSLAAPSHVLAGTNNANSTASTGQAGVEAPHLKQSKRVKVNDSSLRLVDTSLPPLEVRTTLPDGTTIDADNCVYRDGELHCYDNKK